MQLHGATTGRPSRGHHSSSTCEEVSGDATGKIQAGRQGSRAAQAGGPVVAVVVRVVRTADVAAAVVREAIVHLEHELGDREIWCCDLDVVAVVRSAGRRDGALEWRVYNRRRWRQQQHQQQRTSSVWQCASPCRHSSAHRCSAGQSTDRPRCPPCSCSVALLRTWRGSPAEQQRTPIGGVVEGRRARWRWPVRTWYTSILTEWAGSIWAHARSAMAARSSRKRGRGSNQRVGILDGWSVVGSERPDRGAPPGGCALLPQRTGGVRRTAMHGKRHALS